MTVRRYYDDATTTRFTAVVVQRLIHEGQPAVVLDETYFYPTSGGQPNDIGQLTDGDFSADVVDVFAESPGAPVIHILDRPWTGRAQVQATIDWPRRFDHMQQHTGQHILSQAFIRVAEAETVGFHLSPQTVTIDLNTAELSDAQLDRVEQLANEVVWANVPTIISQVSVAEAADLHLRKLPTKHDGQVRLVAVGDFDLSACGGTHVAASGQVGLIKIIKKERRGDTQRVEFSCGGRALADYHYKNSLLVALSTLLTTGQEDLPEAIGRLQADGRQWRSLALAQEKELARQEASRLIALNPPIAGLRVVAFVLTDREPEALRRVVAHLIEHEQTVALAALVTPERLHLVFGRAADAPGHMGELLRQVAAEIPGGKGGGSPTMAQGGGPAMPAADLEDILQAAAVRLRASTNTVE